MIVYSYVSHVKQEANSPTFSEHFIVSCRGNTSCVLHVAYVLKLLASIGHLETVACKEGKPTLREEGNFLTSGIRLNLRPVTLTNII